MSSNQFDKVRLFNELQRWSLEDLQTLCFYLELGQPSLALSYDKLAGQTSPEKARSLIRHLQKYEGFQSWAHLRRIIEEHFTFMDATFLPELTQTSLFQLPPNHQIEPSVEGVVNPSDEFERIDPSFEKPESDLEIAPSSVSFDEFIDFWLVRKLKVVIFVCLLIFAISLIALWMRGNAEDIDSLTPPPNAQLGDEWVRPTDGMVMVFVPAGTFMMGSTEQEINDALAVCVQIFGSSNCSRANYEDEEYREVTLEGFWIDKYEVTNAQYQLCVDDGACNASVLANDSTYNGENYPVVGVSWDDAVAYAEWAGVELPTEEQWEYAARGEERRIYPWGDTFDGTRLNCYSTDCPNDGYEYTAPVGSYPEGASWVGALDMAGNVLEWTSSPYDSVTFVLRGGSWYFRQNVVRASNRLRYSPDIWSLDVGFRLVSPIFLSSDS